MLYFPLCCTFIVVFVLYDVLYCLCCINLFVLYACSKKHVLYFRVIFLCYISHVVFSCYILCVEVSCFFVLYFCVIFFVLCFLFLEFLSRIRVVPAPAVTIYLVDINETHYWGSVCGICIWVKNNFLKN